VAHAYGYLNLIQKLTQSLGWQIPIIQVWWRIPEPQQLEGGQDYKFLVSLGYIERPCLKKRMDHGLNCRMYNYKGFKKKSENLQDLELTKEFLDLPPKSKTHKKKTDYLGLM
jgi:hypothetical protein